MNRNEELRLMAELETRLTALEYNVQRLLGVARLSWEQPPASNGLPSDVIAAMSRGDKLVAIKLLVERLGVSLSQAKEAVDRGHL